MTSGLRNNFGHSDMQNALLLIGQQELIVDGACCLLYKRKDVMVPYFELSIN